MKLHIKSTHWEDFFVDLGILKSHRAYLNQAPLAAVEGSLEGHRENRKARRDHSRCRSMVAALKISVLSDKMTEGGFGIGLNPISISFLYFALTPKRG